MRSLFTNPSQVIIWHNISDKRFDCNIIRITPQVGNLVIVDINNGQILLDSKVPLTFKLKEGPSIEDIHQWKKVCIKVIDEYGEKE